MNSSGNLPSADEFFGDPGELPSADQFFGPRQAPRDQPGMPDWYFSRGPRANIMSAFGQGAAQGWGAEPLGMSEETSKFFRDAGIFNDLDAGHQNWLRTFNEALMRPAAIGLETVMRGGGALLRGTQAAFEAGFEREGLPEPLARDIAALPEAFPRGRTELGVPAVRPPGVAAPVSREANLAAVRALEPLDLNAARSLGIIGEGEAGWKGTIETGPDYERARAAAVKQVREASEEEPHLHSYLTDSGPAAPPPPDIHQLARGIAPDTFQKYDALGLQQDTLRRQLDDLDEMRRDGTSPAINALDRQIMSIRTARLEETSQQTRAEQANQIRDLEAERGKLADGLQKTGDTAEMTAIRQQMAQLDFQMRDLSPEVSDAYRKAQETAAEPAQAPEPVPAPEVAATPEETAPAAPLPPPERVVPDIRNDVQRQLIAAGRSPEEARASSALVAAHYDARAARFGGALGSPEELYAREAPSVEAGQGKAAAGTTTLSDGQATIRLMAKADASTFIHETAHAWLEELLRDGLNERAPADLRADVGSVKSWLGVAEDEATIPTRGHEKFARGFERYMMEGRAPSSNLGRVFDQFKQWLTQIYRTVARLRSPITDDIRHVYDRLLALPNREPVIAPDMEIPRTFAEEHEALAERTPPELAHGAAERVRAESDRVATEKAPEVYGELAGRGEPGVSGGAPPGRPAEGGGFSGHGIEAGAEPGSPAAAEPAGAVSEGRGAAAPQGATMVATADRPFEPAGTPAETRFTDRAGNIRLDTLGTPEDVNQVIRQTAVDNADFIGARRGVISDAEVLRLADALGMDASKLNRRKLGQAFNAEQVIAARKLLIQSANEVRSAMAKAADSTDDKDLMAFAAAMDRHRMIQEQVSGVTAEAGRALRAFREIEGTKEAEAIGHIIRSATGRTLFQLRRIAKTGMQLQTPQQVSKFIQDSNKPGFFDWLQSFFVNNLISGPKTHGTYMIGNGVLGLFKATAETGASAAIGRVREAVTGERGERVEFGEVPAQLFGAMYGQRPAWQAAWRAFLTNETAPLGGEVVASGSAFSKGVIPNPEVPFFHFKAPIGTVLESPSRAVTALHTLTRVTSYESSLHGTAFRVAKQEGLSGDALAARINQLVTDPTEEMMAEAVKNANENALMQRAPYGSLTNKVQQVMNWGVRVPDLGPIPMGTLRPLKFIDPFVAISSNVIKSAIVQRTPLGILSAEIRADLSGANGGLAFDRAAGRMLAGTSFYIMAGGLAAEGLLTDSGPTDAKKSAMLRMTGWMPHALKVGDIYYDIHRLGVIGMASGIAADLWHVAHAIGAEDMATVASMGVHAFAQNILDESFMRGPAEMIQAITDHDRYGPAFVRNFLSSIAVPFSVGMSQVAREIDPHTRQARTTMDAILRKIPYASETLEPLRDIWGEPIPNRESIIPGITAIYESRVNNDPVNQRMVALGMGPARPERKIRGVELTPQQYDDYSRIAGRMAKMQLDKIIPSAGFSQAPEIAQREVISKTISAAREAARTLIMKQNQEIIKQAVTNKTAGLHH